MMLWGVILLVINMALLGSIFYIFFFRRPAAQKSHARQDELVRRLNDRIEEVKTIFEKLEKKSADLSMREKGLKERQAVLDEIMESAKASAGAKEAPVEDVYTTAMKMLRSGVPTGEIARSLGLLNGEAELIRSLHRM